LTAEQGCEDETEADGRTPKTKAAGDWIEDSKLGEDLGARKIGSKRISACRTENPS
jgi:hypothetical protein